VGFNHNAAIHNRRVRSLQKARRGRLAFGCLQEETIFATPVMSHGFRSTVSVGDRRPVAGLFRTGNQTLVVATRRVTARLQEQKPEKDCSTSVMQNSPLGFF
jgi:hypothetical protein